jgi:hypothetical protein
MDVCSKFAFSLLQVLIVDEFGFQSDGLANEIMLHEGKPFVVQIVCLTYPSLDPDHMNLLFSLFRSYFS